MGEINIREVGAYLEKVGLAKFTIVEDTPTIGRLLTGWDGAYIAAIDVNHATHTMAFVVPGIASASRDQTSPGRLADILMAIGFANYALIIGRFAYDPSDGELRYTYAMPIDNARISFEQFAHVMAATVQAVNYWAPRIKAATEGARTGESIVDSFMGHLAGYKS